jgi:hypothetical protein
VWAPKLGELLPAELAGNVYLFDDEPAVLSSEPGRNDYTPAWRVFRVEPTDGGRAPHSEADVLEAEKSGSLTVGATDIVLNTAVVKWSSGEMPVDSDLKEYLGGGQLIEPADDDGLSATFKLHECFPSLPLHRRRHVVGPDGRGDADRSLARPDKGSSGRRHRSHERVHERSSGLGTDGIPAIRLRFSRGSQGVEPYWEPSYTNGRRSGRRRVLKTQVEIHAARHEGEIEEFPGTPDTNGATSP